MKKEEKIAKKINELHESIQELKEMGVGYLLVTSFEKKVTNDGFSELRSSVFSDFRLGDMAPALASYFSENPTVLPVIVNLLSEGYSQETIVEKAKRSEKELERKKKEWN